MSVPTEAEFSSVSVLAPPDLHQIHFS